MSKSKRVVETQPIHVAVPSVLPEKMRAIQTVADALKSLAEAINGQHVNVVIRDCSVTTHNHDGISVKCGDL